MSNDERRYRLSPLAERDLEEIWRYTYRAWSSAQADQYVTDILDVIEALASGSRVGRDASAVRPGYWKYPVGKHLLFYRHAGDTLEIVRVLHQRMDVAGRLANESH